MNNHVTMESTAFSASPTSRSLKTTIPIAIVNVMKIKPQDVLIWDIKVEEEEMIIVIRKKRT